MKRPDELTYERLVAVVSGLQSILWRRGGRWDPDKAWDADTIEGSWGEVGDRVSFRQPELPSTTHLAP